MALLYINCDRVVPLESSRRVKRRPTFTMDPALKGFYKKILTSARDDSDRSTMKQFALFNEYRIVGTDILELLHCRESGEARLATTDDLFAGLPEKLGSCYETLEQTVSLTEDTLLLLFAKDTMAKYKGRYISVEDLSKMPEIKEHVPPVPVNADGKEHLQLLRQSIEARVDHRLGFKAEVQAKERRKGGKLPRVFPERNRKA